MVARSVGGSGAIARNVTQAGGALPAAIGVYAVQLCLSGLSWRESSGARWIKMLTFVRIRWIREGVNTLLPTAQIGGRWWGCVSWRRRAPARRSR